MDLSVDYMNRIENDRLLLEQASMVMGYAMSHGGEMQLRATVEVVDDLISVYYLGGVAQARARLVSADGEMAYEYTFYQPGHSAALWQFYLVREAQNKFGLSLSPTAHAPGRICDHDNPHVRDKVAVPVARAMLGSPSLHPNTLAAATT